MSYKQYPVHPFLQKWIRYFWSYDVYTEQVQSLHIRSFADRFPRLIFQDIRSSSLIKEKDGVHKPICYLSGIDTQPSDAFWESRFSHFGISFHPHGLHALFGISAHEVTNQTPDLQWIIKEEITSLLLNTVRHEEKINHLEHYFYNKIASQKIDWIINEIVHTQSLDQFACEKNLFLLAKKYHLSERQLQRRFKQSIGISARKFSQLIQFEKSLQQLSSAHYGDLTRIAHQLEYADQAHFNREFKAFSGLTPYEFIRTKTIGSESASFIYIA